MVDKLQELFADETVEPAEDTLTEQVEDGEDTVGEEVEEPEVSDEGTEGEETATEEPDENSIEYWKMKVEELEKEKRLLQSKKDREIWEIQNKLKELEEKLNGAKQEEPQQEEIDVDELRDLMLENPVEAIKKIIKSHPEILEEVLPKVTQKQLTAKQQKLLATWQKQAEVLAQTPDYQEVFTNENHPLAKAIAEFVNKNKDRYLIEGNENLVIDAIKYAKKQVKIKRDNTPTKKKSTAVGKKASMHAPDTPQRLSIDDLFA